MNRLGSGTLIPAATSCRPEWSDTRRRRARTAIPPSGGNIAKAKQLVQQSGMAGTPVTVWSETRSPRQQWMTYYTQFLNQIGFKATQKVIADATYFSTIGNLKLNPQTGLRRLEPGLPEPDRLLPAAAGDRRSSRPTTRTSARSTTRTSTATSGKLGKIPTSQLNTIASQWQALDEYVAKKAYVGVFGYQTFPAFTSNRIDQNYVFHPLYGWDWSSFTAEVVRWRDGPGRVGCPGPPLSDGNHIRFRHRILRRRLGRASREGEELPPGIGPWRLAWRRLRRNKVALFFGGVFLVIVRAVPARAGVLARHRARRAGDQEFLDKPINDRRQDRVRGQPDRDPDRPDLAQPVLPRRRRQRPRRRRAAALRRAQLARDRLHRDADHDGARDDPRRRRGLLPRRRRRRHHALPRRDLGVPGGAARVSRSAPRWRSAGSTSGCSDQGQLADGPGGRRSGSSTSRTWPSRCAARC